MKKDLKILAILLLSCLILTGCGEKIEFSAGEYSVNSKTLSFPIEADEVPLLDNFTNLEKADFTGSLCYEELSQWQTAHPEVEVLYSLPLCDDLVLSSLDTELSIDDQFMKCCDMSALAENLKFFPNLEIIRLCSKIETKNLKLISEFSKIRPDLCFDYELEISGNTIDYSAKSLHLESLSKKDAKKLSYVLTAMPELKTIYLGSDEINPDLGFEDIASLVNARPDLEFRYNFTAFGKELSLMDKELDLKLIKMYDEGQLVRNIISCMPRLKVLDMDSCGVSNEAMAAIRDDFPQVKVIWRIWFGSSYTARTDTEKILASKPSAGGPLKDDNTKALKYCTDVKAIDLGHNEILSDISFISCMPKLEVVLMPMQAWSDASPFANCPNIEYLEIQTTNCKDLTPLKNLKKLKHLNICYLFELDDISPIYELDLERLWIGCIDPVPEEQVKEFQRLHPKCEVNTTTYDPTEGGWRYPMWDTHGTGVFHPRYEKLRETMEYDRGGAAYNFIWNDPIAWSAYN